MTRAKRILGCAAAALALVLVASSPAAAESGGWRPIYDVVMLWINFAILVFALYKLLKRPLRDFFQDRKEEMAAEIRRIEAEKDRAQEQVKEAAAELEKGKERLERIRARIVQEGERIRDRIIEEAQDQSRVLVNQARRRIDHQIFTARRQFKAEMVDMAVKIALERLPKEVTEADNQHYIELYLESAL